MILQVISDEHNWLVVSTHLKNISQIGSFPLVGLQIKNIRNHHLVMNTNLPKKPPPTPGHNFTAPPNWAPHGFSGSAFRVSETLRFRSAHRLHEVNELLSNRLGVFGVLEDEDSLRIRKAQKWQDVFSKKGGFLQPKNRGDFHVTGVYFTINLPKCFIFTYMNA